MKMGFMYLYDGKEILPGKTLYVNETHIPEDYDREKLEMKINRNIKDGEIKLKYVSQKEIQKVLEEKEEGALILYNVSYYGLTDYMLGFVYTAEEGKPIARLSSINRGMAWTAYFLYIALITAGMIAFFALT